jgi:hypothetical protein
VNILLMDVARIWSASCLQDPELVLPLYRLIIMRVITGDETGLIKSVGLEARHIVVMGQQTRARAIRALAWAKQGVFAAARADGVVSLWEDDAKVRIVSGHMFRGGRNCLAKAGAQRSLTDCGGGPPPLPQAPRLLGEVKDVKSCSDAIGMGGLPASGRLLLASETGNLQVSGLFTKRSGGSPTQRCDARRVGGGIIIREERSFPAQVIRTGLEGGEAGDSEIATGAPLNAFALSTHGSSEGLAAVGGKENDLAVWDVGTGERLWKARNVPHDKLDLRVPVRPRRRCRRRDQP